MTTQQLSFFVSHPHTHANFLELTSQVDSTLAVVVAAAVVVVAVAVVAVVVAVAARNVDVVAVRAAAVAATDRSAVCLRRATW